MRNEKIGLYISIPFCRSKCTYCNFASGVYPAAEHARYVSRLLEDLQSAAEWAGHRNADLPRGVDTVYLGGGTPSLLRPELLSELFQGIRAHFQVEPNAEITAECAPGQIADETLTALAQAGVNRVSLGVQSFVDREAQVSGRLHNRATVRNDLRRLRAAGITNLNLDLIAGLAGQTDASWNESIEALLECDVPHASVYMLEIDEDSRLGREMLAGGARYHAGLVPTDDTIASMYETATERLGAAGLEQYEISNFARIGFNSQHNLRYWKRQPYLGIGLDASSMLRGYAERDGFVLRSSTTDDLKGYLDRAKPAATNWLGRAAQHEEAWFLGLRLNQGVDPAEIEREFGRLALDAAAVVVEAALADGLLEWSAGRVRLTAQGRLLSNEVFQRFLDLGGGNQAIEPGPEALASRSA